MRINRAIIVKQEKEESKSKEQQQQIQEQKQEFTIILNEGFVSRKKDLKNLILLFTT